MPGDGRKRLMDTRETITFNNIQKCTHIITELIPIVVDYLHDPLSILRKEILQLWHQEDLFHDTHENYDNHESHKAIANSGNINNLQLQWTICCKCGNYVLLSDDYRDNYPDNIYCTC